MRNEVKEQIAADLHAKLLSVDELYEALNMILEGVTDETGTA